MNPMAPITTSGSPKNAPIHLKSSAASASEKSGFLMFTCQVYSDSRDPRDAGESLARGAARTAGVRP